MSTINTILIKRRLASSPLNTIPTLSGGELAFSEKNNTLYYGSELGTLKIGGDGAFVDRTTSQSISGDKSFVGSTTLSSTTFSIDSLIDVGANLLTNVAYPSANTDAATKKYVDDLALTVAGDFVDRTNAQTISGVKTFFDNTVFNKYIDVTEYVSASAYKINTDIVIDDNKNASFANIDASGNLTVQGDFKVYGASSVIDTIVTTTSAFSITNDGSGPALTVTQTGNEAIAIFYDDSNSTALYIDGKTTTAGYVGIGTGTPNEKLTVSGNISSTGNIFGVNANLTGTLYVDSTLTLNNNLSGNYTTSSIVGFTIDGGSF